MRGRLAFAIAIVAGCKGGDAPTPSRVADPPPRAPTGTPITLAQLVSRDLHGGMVNLDVVMLPETLIETEGDGPSAHHRYVLGVDGSAEYFGNLKKVADAADKLVPRARAIAAHAKNEKQYVATMKAIADLLAQAEPEKPGLGDVLVVDVGLEPKLDVELQTIYQSGFGALDLSTMPVPLPPGVIGPSYEDVGAALAKLEAEKPPNPESPMPDISGLGVALTPFSPPDLIHRYNAVVTRFNRELRRRRPYLARHAALVLERVAIELRRRAARTPDHLVGQVTTPDDTAEKTLDKNTATTHRVYLEVSSDWAKAYFASGDLLVQSDPPGADVTIDGTKRGQTPYVATGLAVGSKHEVALARAGARPVTRTITITAVPSRLIAVSELLEPAR